MKKLFVIFSLLFIIGSFFMIEAKLEDKTKMVGFIDEGYTNKKEVRAVFVSYLEYLTYLQNQSEKIQKANIIKILDNINSMNFNTIVLQVRSFSDAIYKSKIFPWSYTISGEEGVNPGYDVLEYIIKEAHKRNLEVHAWVNPFRIRSDEDISKISKDNPAYNWLNTNKVKVVKGSGIYYNPASLEVHDLVIKGIKEIIDNYEVDGIHFDDYFYPSVDIDYIEYLDYKNKGGTLSIKEYHLDNINRLVRDVYKCIKEKDKNLLFGISPEGNIDNNYNSNFADTRKWASEDGYVDYLMPQIYFGFENEARPYLDTIKLWNDLITNDKVSLIPALAFYKVGSVDKYAKGGLKEWILNNDVIKKQILVSRNYSNYKGFSIFRYDYLVNDKYQTDNTSTEKANMISVMN